MYIGIGIYVLPVVSTVDETHTHIYLHIYRYILACTWHLHMLNINFRRPCKLQGGLAEVAIAADSMRNLRQASKAGSLRHQIRKKSYEMPVFAKFSEASDHMLLNFTKPQKTRKLFAFCTDNHGCIYHAHPNGARQRPQVV